jgi:hypothetical protein
MEEWRYSSIFLGFGTRWKRVVSFTSLPLYPGERAGGARWVEAEWALDSAWSLENFSSRLLRNTGVHHITIDKTTHFHLENGSSM